QRQIVHGTKSIGENKAESAGRFVDRLNDHVSVDAISHAITQQNAASILATYDLVLDGTDNLDTRRTVAAAAEAARKPLVSGAVSMFSGQVTIFAPYLGGPAHDAL